MSAIEIDRLLHLESAYSEIREWKRSNDAVILAHYYMPAELQVLERDGGIADFIGDSLGLSVEATRVTKQNIVFCGVRFMAETAKILNPSKRVFIPDNEAGCSLASSISAEDVRVLRSEHPGVPVIAYINTYAETKAECDICCTSRNALKIVESFESDTLIFLPDFYMGQNLQKQISKQSTKKLILWKGVCEVHEQFTSDSLQRLTLQNPQAEVLLHWEVPNSAVESALAQSNGVLGSTNDILRYVGESSATQFILASECDLGATLHAMYPAKQFITPCIKCQHMKKITVENTLATLKTIGTPNMTQYEITLDADVMTKARTPIHRMLQFT